MTDLPELLSEWAELCPAECRAANPDTEAPEGYYFVRWGDGCEDMITNRGDYSDGYTVLGAAINALVRVGAPRVALFLDSPSERGDASALVMDEKWVKARGSRPYTVPNDGDGVRALAVAAVEARIAYARSVRASVPAGEGER